MAASPPWKVYNRAGVYQAACKEAAAAVVAPRILPVDEDGPR